MTATQTLGGDGPEPGGAVGPSEPTHRGWGTVLWDNDAAGRRVGLALWPSGPCERR